MWPTKGALPVPSSPIWGGSHRPKRPELRRMVLWCRLGDPLVRTEAPPISKTKPRFFTVTGDVLGGTADKGGRKEARSRRLNAKVR